MENQAQVLVLDDEPIVCERLKQHLEKNGFSVHTFTESAAALEQLEKKSFDVVVTDLKMPGASGLDVMHYVRQHGDGTQVIIITGYSTMEAAREAEYSGVHGFLTKPFQLDEVAAMVKKAAKKASRLRRGARGKG